MKTLRFSALEDFISTVHLFARGLRNDHCFLSVYNKKWKGYGAAFWDPTRDMYFEFERHELPLMADEHYGTVLKFEWVGTTEFLGAMKELGHFFTPEEEARCFGFGKQVLVELDTEIPFLLSKKDLQKCLEERPIKLPEGHEITKFNIYLRDGLDKNDVKTPDALYTMTVDYARAMEAMADKIYQLADKTKAILLKGGMECIECAR